MHRSRLAAERKAARLLANPDLVCAVSGCGRIREAHGLCHGHRAAKWRGVAVEDMRPFLDTDEKRFLAKVQKLPSGHWIWTGALASEGRYGVATFEKRTRPAHVVSWLLFRGPIPAELSDVDHLCRKTLCVNPDHLEPKTHRANVLAGDAPPAANAAKTHCGRGHAYSEENTYVRKNGGRDCRTCMRERTRVNMVRWRERQKQKAST